MKLVLALTTALRCLRLCCTATRYNTGHAALLVAL